MRQFEFSLVSLVELHELVYRDHKATSISCVYRFLGMFGKWLLGVYFIVLSFFIWSNNQKVFGNWLFG